MKYIISYARKFRLLHIAFWLIKYESLVHTVLKSSSYRFLFPYLDMGVVIFFQMVSVYFVNEYLLPGLFLKKRYYAFPFSAILSIVCFSMLALWILKSYTSLFIPGFHISYLKTGIGNVIDTLTITLVFFIIYIARHYFQKDRNNSKMARQQLEAELSFLKAQLNPHFLFNTINSIYIQMDDDTVAARHTLLQFSTLLRYQLYDCSVKATPVYKELRFIENFIALNSVRYGEKINVRFEHQGVTDDLEIAPLLLIPFVENAFKHIAVGPDSKATIEIHARQESNNFSVEISNSYNPVHETLEAPGGIGLQNVKRRLELLYPNKHSLKIEQKDARYIVVLKIELNEISLPYSRR